ncbi:MAG: helix-turn-helix domain-containing protein [Elusimicrobiota bacterium]
MKVKQRRGVPLKEWLDEELKDPEFKRHYDEASVKWHVAMQIVAARQKANMTQGQLAREIGDRQQNVSRIESGEQNVTIGTLDKIAKAVGGQLVVKIVESKTSPVPKEVRTGISKVKERKKIYKVKRSRWTSGGRSRSAAR